MVNIALSGCVINSSNLILKMTGELRQDGSCTAEQSLGVLENDVRVPAMYQSGRLL